MKSLTPAKLMILMVVLFACLIGAFIVKRLTAVEPVVKKATMRNIPLALADLPAGTVIKREHIGLGPWPTKEVVDDVMVSAPGIIGRIVKNGIKGVMPIRGSQLYAFGELPPLKVSDKYQAVTFKLTNNAAILDGLIKPGDFADIHFTLTTMLDDPRVKKLGGVSMTLFRGVRVIAINQNFVQAPVLTSQNSVTVEVPAESANLLLVAAGKGDLTLTYTKNDEGISTVAINDADRATLEELLSLPPIPEPPAPPPPPQPLRLDPALTTMIYRRSGRSANYFRDNQPAQGPYPSGYDNSINNLYGPGSNPTINNAPINNAPINNGPGYNGPVNNYGPGNYGPGYNAPGYNGPGYNGPGYNGPANNGYRNINGYGDPNWGGGYNGGYNGGYGNGVPGMPSTSTNPAPYGPGQDMNSPGGSWNPGLMQSHTPQVSQKALNDRN